MRRRTPDSSGPKALSPPNCEWFRTTTLGSWRHHPPGRLKPFQKHALRLTAPLSLPAWRWRPGSRLPIPSPDLVDASGHLLHCTLLTSPLPGPPCLSSPVGASKLMRPGTHPQSLCPRRCHHSPSDVPRMPLPGPTSAPSDHPVGQRWRSADASSWPNHFLLLPAQLLLHSDPTLPQPQPGRHLSLGTWLPQPFLSRLLRQPGGVQLPIATLGDVPAPNTAGP